MVFVNLIDSISELLFKHNCVIIPDFGGFISNYKPSEFEESKHIINPSSKKVAFNQSLIENDGLLVSYWSQQKQVSYSDALVEVLTFSDFLKDKINTNKSFDFKNIGTFYLNTEGRIIFVPYQGLNFLESSFGLYPVKIRSIHNNIVTSFTLLEDEKALESLPILEIKEKVIEIKSKPQRTVFYKTPYLFKAASIAFIFGLSLFTIYYFKINSNHIFKSIDNGNENKATILNLDTNTEKPILTKKKSLEALDFKIEQAKIIKLKTELDSFKSFNKAKQESYNVILGYYSSESIAKKMLNKIISEYSGAKLTELSSEGYGIILENFYKHNTANLFCVMLKQNGYKNVKIEKQMVFGN